MATVIAVTGRKGGIGKSTLAGNLAGEFAADGWTVAVLDTDPQQSLYKWGQLGKGLLSRITIPVQTDHPESFQQAIETAKATAQVVLVDTPPAFEADTPAKAALLEGFNVVGIEREPDYFEICKARVAYVAPEKTFTAPPTGHIAQRQQTLFEATA